MSNAASLIREGVDAPRATKTCAAVELEAILNQCAAATVELAGVSEAVEPADVTEAVEPADAPEAAWTAGLAAARRPVVAFDADGVLLVPWSAPARVFPAARRLLDLVRAAPAPVLLVASYNPDVPEILRREGLLALFEHVRAGSNAEWRPPYERLVHRRGMCKAAQLRAMLAACGRAASDLVYFDDDRANVRTVRAALPEARVMYVRSTRGVAVCDLLRLSAAHYAVDEREEADTHAANALFEAVVAEVRAALGGAAPDYAAAADPVAPLGRDHGAAHRLVLAYYLDV